MSKPLVLVVESDHKTPSLASLLKDDYDVTVVNTGNDALHVFEKNHMKIRLVLMEIVLPDVSGMYVLRRLREISTLPEIIVCSGREDIELAVSAMKEGAYDYVITPTDAIHLTQIVAQAINSSDFVARMQQSQKSIFDFIESDVKISAVQSLASNQETFLRSFDAEDIVSLFPGPNSESDLEDPEDFKSTMIVALENALMTFPKAKVLVIEDEDLYRTMIAKFLSERYDVITARDAQEAITMCDHHDRIEVILTDMVLPDVSGANLVPVLKKKHPNSEIIVLTAFERIDKAVQAIRGGASDYLNKPVLKEQLLDTIHKAFERRYFQSILPEIKRQIVESKLSDSSKYILLENLSGSRKRQGRSVSMLDIYAFFPELRNTFIPEGLTLPMRIQNGLEGFVKDLKEKLAQLNTTI
jgi:DNA-binding NtrC family response regulator